MRGGVLDVILWLIIASAFVAAIMNPTGFTSAVTAISGFVTGESAILTGTGYKTAK
jgi:hypothetical protein